MNLSFQTRALVALAAAMALGGCSKNSAEPGQPATTATAAASGAGTTTITGTTPPAPSGDALKVGDPAPDFSAKSHDGKDVKLSAYKGHPVVVYFYPKDETPGCTKQACGFRDAWNELDKKGVVLIGISADNDASHRAFAEHHKLPFLLVSDPDGKLAKQFGVPFRMCFTSRQTIVIDAEGRIKKLYRDVDVSTHANDVLKDVG